MDEFMNNNLSWELIDHSIHKLLSLSQKVNVNSSTRSIRLAVLGDCATQHYCQTLGAILKLRGWHPEIYEAEFDTFHQEILNPDSELYRHKPEFVILFTCTQAASARFSTSEKKDSFDVNYLADLNNLWQTLSSNQPCRIVQHLLAAPLDRPYGNQSLAQPDTLPRAIASINYKLVEAAEKRQVLIIDTDYQACLVGKKYWFDERLWCQAKLALSPKFLPALANSTADTILAELGINTKCIVLDLDNTLWGGVLADCGAEGIEIGHTGVGLAFTRFQHYLAELKRRGILLAICSKNNLAPVMSVLDSHPDMVLRSDDFAAIVANYKDKASNILTIQGKLNIGLDSFVFLDDSKFERDLVRSALPAVIVPELPEDPAEYLYSIAAWNMFEGCITTAEDRERQSYYKTNEKREVLRSKYSDFDSYLRDLEMKAEVKYINKFTLPRVTQLIQRSNQFNLTTIRYGEAEINEMVKDKNIHAFTIRLTDRLGDSGIVAVVILKNFGQDLHVDTWIMSCRVLGRGLEEFTMNHITNFAKTLGSTRILGRYVKTEKNAMVEDLYKKLGFLESFGVTPSTWFLPVTSFEILKTYIKYQCNLEFVYEK